MNHKNRNINLDALRTIAVLMVLGRHRECVPIWTKIGWAGVDLFFVLSGFLISGLLFAEWRSQGSIDVKRFYIRRGLKIYPSFYVLLLLTIIANQFWHGIPPFPVNRTSLVTEAFFLQNYFQGIWGHTWSLAIEEHFYVLLPLALRLLLRADSPDPFPWLPRVFILVAAACLLMRIASGSGADYRTYLLPTHFRIDALLFGVLLAYYRRFHADRFQRIRQSRMALAIIVLSLLLLFVAPLESPMMYTVGFSLIYLGFGFVLAKAIDFQPGRYSSRAIHALGALGVYSYSIYLWHFAIARVMPQFKPLFLSFTIYVAVSAIVGVSMAKLIEMPALAFRDRFFPSVRLDSAVQPHGTGRGVAVGRLIRAKVTPGGREII